MAISGGDGSITLTTKVDEGGLNKGLSSLKNGVGAFGKAFAVAGAAGVAAFAGITKAAVDSYADFEQLSGGVQKIFNEIDYSVIEKDAQEAFKTMQMSANQYLEVMTTVGANFASTLGDAKGYEVAKQGMKAITDFATGTGRSVDELSEKYQMITKSTSSYQSIADQFAGVLPATSAGFLEQAQAAGFLSDSYTKLTEVPMAEYQEAVTQMLTKGVDALGLTNNAANEASTTLSGSFSMLQGAWSNLLVAIANPEQDLNSAIDDLKGSLLAVADNLLPRIGAVFDSIFGSIPTPILVAATAVGSLVAGITAYNTVATISSAITAAKAAVEAGEATTLWSAVAAQIGLNTAMLASPITWVVAGIVALVGAFVILWNKSEGFRNFWIGLWETIKTAVAPVIDWIKEAFSTAWDAVAPYFGAIWNEISSVFSDVASWFGEKFGEAVNFIKTHWDTIVAFFTTIWNEIVSVFSDVASWFGEIFSMAQEAIEAAWDEVAPYFEAIWDGIKTVFSVVSSWFGEMFGEAVNFIRTHWDTIVSYFSAIWNGIKAIFSVAGVFFKGAFATALELVKAVWNTATSFFSMVWNSIKGVFAVVQAVLSGDFRGAWEAIKGIWGNVSSFFSSVWNSIKGVFSAVSSWFSSTFSAAASAIKSVFGNITSFFSGIWSNIKNVFSGAMSHFSSVGSNIISGIISGVSSAASGLYDKLRGIATSALEAAKGALGIHSPSTVFRDIIGKMIPAGIAVGIDKARYLVSRAMDRMFDDTRSEVQKKLDSYNETLLESEEKYAKESLAIEERRQKQEWESKVEAIEKEFQQEKAKAKTAEEITEAENKRKEKLDKLYTDRRLELTKKAEDMYLDSLKETAKKEREIFEARQKDIENLKKTIVETYTTLAEEAIDSIADLAKAQGDLAGKLFDYGDLMYEVERKRYGKIVKVPKLSNLEDQIKVLENYEETLLKLRDKGVSEAFFEMVRGMGIDEGLDYATEILKLSDDKFEEYLSNWDRKKAVSDRISKSLYQKDAEKLEAEIIEKLETVQDEMYKVGKSSAEEFGTGFLDQLRFIVSEIKIEMRRAFGDLYVNGVDTVISGESDIIRVPALAKGGIAPRKMLAMIGERGREAVLPLENNTSWMDALADKVSSRMGGGNSTVVLQVGEREFGRAVVEYGDKARKITGTRLVSR